MGGKTGLPSRRPSAFAADDDGQTVVLMALMFTMMLGFAALAVDVGLYYAERRNLQDAVDAAALACVRAYSEANATSATAWAAAETILENYNLKRSPGNLYTSYQVPAQGSETYYDSIVSGQTLKNGVLPQLSPYTGCRVAVYVDVPTTLLKIANPGLQTLALNARAYAIAKGGMIPIVVPKYSNGPGPGNGDTSNFIHHTMAENQDYQCTTSSDSGCTAASTTTKGREFVLFGASQKATNDNSFRGYIAPDVRDFQTQVNDQYQHTSYNGVAADASINTLKDFEANWILEGYPGPDICTVSTTSFLPCAEVAVING
ncbi:MAG: Tad domain-containing protein, partial [Chloroflexi bacterium]|nr:Tad domain-containing protein [Chloroflexota bacterium]